MFLFPRRKQGWSYTSNILSLTVKAFWPFGDAHDASVLADSTGRGNNLTPYLRVNPTTIRFRFGRNGAHGVMSGQQTFGSLKGWGKWKRILTGAEKAALYGKEYWPFSTTTSLQDACAYYKMDEAGGATTYADATGRGNTLTSDGNATYRSTGPTGSDYATRFLVDNTTLTRESPGTDLQCRQETTTVCGWVQLDSKPSGGYNQQCFWTSLENETSSSGFNVYFDPTSDRFALDNDGGDAVSLNKGAFVLANNFGSPTIGTWYFLIAEFDVPNNEIRISVNNGTPDVLPRFLQPTRSTLAQGVGSLFERNPEGSFATRTSGWDADAMGAVNGNSRAAMTPTVDVSIGNNAKTVWGWFKATDTVTTQTLAGIDGTDSYTTDWAIQLGSNTLTFIFGAQRVTASVSFTDTTTSHLVVAWFDKIANRIHIDVDNTSLAANAAGPATPQTVSYPLYFGSNIYYQFRGVLWGWGVADGIPAAADLDALWNGGMGITP